MATPRGRQMLDDPDRRALQAILFHIAFWHLDLDYFGRVLHQGWPQRDAGIVLWSLSVAANDWQSAPRLARLCTIPINAVLETPWDTANYALEATILRPLWWFGLLDYRQDDAQGDPYEHRHLYRKTPLFDRFLSFAVKLDGREALRH